MGKKYKPQFLFKKNLKISKKRKIENRLKNIRQVINEFFAREISTFKNNF